MCSADLPDVIVLGQRDPDLRGMGKAAEEYLRSLLSHPPYFGTVYQRFGIIDGFSIQEKRPHRFTFLCFVFRDPEAAIALLEFRLARLTPRRRFADLRIQLSSESAVVLAWAAQKGALVRSCGRDSGHVVVTFSRPRIAPGEGPPQKAGT